MGAASHADGERETTMFEPLHGLNTAIFTPFDDNGNVDIGRFEALLNWQIDVGVTGFFVCGSTGEGLYLSPEERRLMAEAAVQIVAGRAANLVVIDPDAPWFIDASGGASKSRNVPYVGREVRGRVTHTVLHGRIVVADGTLV